MKSHERRKIGAYPYYFLAKWNDISMCWFDGKIAFPSYTQAQYAAKKIGRYRISEVQENGVRKDLPYFTVK